MALKKLPPYRAKRAFEAGYKDGIASVVRGGKYGTAPVRLHKTVGSPVTDRTERYDDMMSFKHDVNRAERRLVYKNVGISKDVAISKGVGGLKRFAK